LTKCIFYFLVPLIAALVKQEKATQTVLEQAEVLSVEWYRFVVIFSASRFVCTAAAVAQT